MRRLARLTAVSYLSLVAVIGLIVVVGRHEPLPEPISAYHFKDCAPPCWIGIVLGKTTADIARLRIKNTFAEEYDIDISSTSLGTMFFSDGATGTKILLAVERLELTPKDNPNRRLMLRLISDQHRSVMQEMIFSSGGVQAFPMVGDLINAYGPPSCLSFEAGLASNLLTLVYLDSKGSPFMTAEANVKNFGPLQPVHYVSMKRYPMFGIRCTTWRGFIQGWRYLRK
jgi:hypothetical protein